MAHSADQIYTELAETLLDGLSELTGADGREADLAAAVSLADKAPSPGLAAFIARGGAPRADAGIAARLSKAMATLADVRVRLRLLLERFLAAVGELEQVAGLSGGNEHGERELNGAGADRALLAAALADGLEHEMLLMEKGLGAVTLDMPLAELAALQFFWAQQPFLDDAAVAEFYVAGKVP
ncbi:hypothetical protein WJX81_001080 [Elliptochloris bilobata]|uniref:Uncharacterized protein n=1 Tax=Elliptochloris bilobata TaxID=381761 RepID=A0AAW1QYV4_9CHLO